MRVRTRDFIYTKDELFFATTSYLHPDDKILSFLRYIPDPNGERSRNGQRYSKVDSNQAYEFLGDFHPDYLFDSDKDLKMMGVPNNKVKELLRPEERLIEIISDDQNNKLLKKVVKLADTFNDHASIPFSKMGVSGSILPGLYDPEVSDIDFVIFGLKNHRKAMETFGEIKDKSILKSISDEYWMRLYEKRIKDSSLSFDEFKWYEKRKNNRGVIEGTLFDILATRDWNEIKGKYGQEKYKPMGIAKIKCVVSDALGAFDNPAIYKVEDVQFLEGQKVPVTEVASFTHTYSGQAKDGEEVIVKGKLEKVVDKKTKYRIIVGTTRESFDEYIKLTNH
jgi:predicted nucleotidyltransferase